ncbi:MAG: hypothetical protein IT542_10350 [Rubellimicrobium sp.]|nr:hypothetical protein [Rubellimicrobium sp.]
MRHLTAIALTTSLTALGAGPILAQTACPVAGDIARGITITFSGGGSESFRQTEPGLVLVAGRNPDGTTYTMQLAQGFHLLSWQDTGDPTSLIEYDYAMAPAQMPVPVAGQHHEFAVQKTTLDGTFSEPQVHTYGPPITVDMGGCRYQAFEGLIRYATTDNYTENVVFIPDLGFGYLLWNESDGNPRDPQPAVEIRTGK